MSQGDGCVDVTACCIGRITSIKGEIRSWWGVSSTKMRACLLRLASRQLSVCDVTDWL